MLTSTDTRIKSEADRLFAAFIAAGALPVEAAALQPAETLLDLYGDGHSRARLCYSRSASGRDDAAT